MALQQYEEIWHNPERLRTVVAERTRSSPELFPAGFDQGNRLHGFGRQARQVAGLTLPKIMLVDGTAYWIRPSFVTSDMTEIVDELEYPLVLTANATMSTRVTTSWHLLR